MPASGELLSEFCKNAESTTAGVHLIPKDDDRLCDLLMTLTPKYQKVLIDTDLKDLPETFFKSITPVYQPDTDEMATVPVGITHALCGVAATGSILVAADNRLTAYLGMLTIHHIVVLDAEKIYQRPRDVFNDPNHWLQGQSSFSLITGPSATADMGSLVRGVHGPGHIDIIVMEAK